MLLATTTQHVSLMMPHELQDVLKRIERHVQIVAENPRFPQSEIKGRGGAERRLCSPVPEFLKTADFR